MTSPYDALTSLLQDKVAIKKQQEVGVLRITGVDAKKLLQGQMTCDIKKLSSSNGLYGAICSIKGRIITNFYIVQKGDEILMLMSKDLVEKTLLHLKKYAVFFKTELFNDSENFNISAHVTLNNNEAPLEQLSEELTVELDNGTIAITISNFPIETRWIIENNANISITEENEELVALSSLSARPLITLEQSETVLPQWLNMQRTGGISFTKGCYTGQEIVARMQYRGKSKKQLALFLWENLLDTNKGITDDQGKHIGDIFSLAKIGSIQLAQVILNIDPNETEKFLLDDQKISILPLPYSMQKHK